MNRFNALGSALRPKRHFRCSPSSSFRSSCRPSAWSNASAWSKTRLRSTRSAKRLDACRRSRGGCHRSSLAGRRERDVAFEHRRGDAGRRVQPSGLRHDRGVGAQQRPAARAADGPAARGRGADRAGLRGGLRRILRGSDPNGPAGPAREDLRRLYDAVEQAHAAAHRRRSSRAPVRARSTPLHGSA